MDHNSYVIHSGKDILCHLICKFIIIICLRFKSLVHLPQCNLPIILSKMSNVNTIIELNYQKYMENKKHYIIINMERTI